MEGQTAQIYLHIHALLTRPFPNEYKQCLRYRGFYKWNLLKQTVNEFEKACINYLHAG